MTCAYSAVFPISYLIMISEFFCGLCFPPATYQTHLFNWWAVKDSVAWEIQQPLPLSTSSHCRIWVNIITGLGIYKLFPFCIAKSYWFNISLIPLLKIRIYLSAICLTLYASYFSRKTCFIHNDLFFTRQDSFTLINFYSSGYAIFLVFSLNSKAFFPEG